MDKFSIEFWNDRGGLKKQRKGKNKSKKEAYEKREKEDYNKNKEEGKETIWKLPLYYIISSYLAFPPTI